MKYILAVSGGVDSVVLLDMLAKSAKESDKKLIVAHFDHGIRPVTSRRDAEFVFELAKKYDLPVLIKEGKLGAKASEEEAREARYKFLEECRTKTGATVIVTAHHQDDLLETIAINMIRGTGWRGLAPMSAQNVERPLLGFSKAELVAYAIENQLNWVEDETNYSPRYLRNRVRLFLQKISSTQRKDLLILNAKQQLLRSKVEEVLKGISDIEVIAREFIIALPQRSAVELLRFWTEGKLTILQAKKLYQDIKNANGGIDIQPGGGLVVKLRRGKLEKKLLKTIAKR